MGNNFTPAWIKKGFFNESLFCDDFLSTHQLIYVNGAFFTPEGRVTDTMNLRCEIFDMLRDHKTNSEERTIWDEKTMLAALQTIENPALHLAVHLSMILSLREGEILGLQPSDKESRLCKPCAETPSIRANVQTVCRKCAAAFLHKERTPNLTI